MSKNKTSRRDFTKHLACVASVPILTSFCSNQIPTDSKIPKEEVIKIAAKGLTELVRARYGENINKDDWPKIEQAIARNFATAERLKQTKLKNSDQPATIFRA